MWSLIFGVLTLSFGIWALITGRIKLSEKFVLTGNQARIAGIVLVIAPVIGAVFSLNGPEDNSYIFGSSCYGIIGVVAFAAIQTWRSKRAPQVKTQNQSKPEASVKKEPVKTQVIQPQPSASSVSHKQRMPDASLNSQDEKSDVATKDRIEPIRMPICPKCGNSVLPNDLFCRKCGSPLKFENRCRKCGNIIQPKDRFCVKCGSRVDT